MNLSLVLSHVLADPGGVSRAAVAAATGITRATVSRLVDELIGAGALSELAPLNPGRGRPAVPLVPRRGRFVALGLEVNVGSLSARAVDLTGAVLAEEVVSGDFSTTGPDVAME
ncbi:MAG: helix-turn-helix domain-containing protein, partial [Pauljensenia sp.]